MSPLAVEPDERGVVQLRLDRAEARNALSAELIDALAAFAAAPPPGARAVVLSGAGPVFCAGGDLGWMRAQMAADRATRLAEARRLARMLRALNEMPLPLVARIQGGAFGGGVGLACIADVALAEPAARFGLTETRLGLIPATIAPYVLARMGEGRARRVFMSGRVFDAAEAEALGIVARVAADLDAAVEAEVAPYLAAAPGAVAAAKALARRLGPPIGEAEIEDSVTRLADIWEGTEAAEGIDAFFARRPPAWRTD